MITGTALQQDIEKELAWDPAVNANHIAVSVKGNAVTLMGDADSYWEKCCAVRAVWRVAHVQSVTETLRVDLPFTSERSDDDLALAAMSILEWNAALPRGIEVQAAEGVLTLTGTVTWHFQREEAERAVSPMRGLRGIRNEIHIESSAAPDPRHSIEEAYKRSALVDSSHVKVHVAHGTAALRGAVRTRAEHDEIIRATWSAPGVTAIDDHIAIG